MKKTKTNIKSCKRLRRFLNVLPFPSISNSWPCDPTKVFDKNGAKSTIISRKSGHTDPSAASSLCVRDASLLGKCV